jgi:predicted KAP-like P-loop ATPase
MWADRESAADYLNFQDIAHAAVEVIRSPSMRPVSIGIFGDWGSGKSSLLEQIEGQLKTSEDTIVVKFDAWLFQGYDDARAALLETIAQKLDEAAAENASLLAKTGSLLARVDGFRAMALLAEGAATIAGIPTGGLIARGVEFGGRAIGSLFSSELPDAELVGEGKNLAHDATEETKKLWKARKESTPPQQIAKFRKLYGEILGELGKTLVVFIDNLDRCLPKQAIQTLEAIRLFLFLPNTAFVIAADEHMIRDAVAHEYQGLSERHKTDYLDKLIQVPLHVPRASEADVRAYLYLLFAEDLSIAAEAREALRAALTEALSQSWHKSPLERASALELLGASRADNLANAFDLADRLSPLLARSSNVRGNPRIVKRLLNSMRQREAIAKLRKITIDPGLIAKMAVFERCAGPAPAVDMYRLIDANGGKPSILLELETFSGEGLPAGCPESWTKVPGTPEFIREWSQLKPSLANVDLRALVYLSRETLPLGMRSAGMSAVAAETLSVLMKANLMSSPTAAKQLEKLDANDALSVLDGLLVELRTVTDWSTKPEGLVGALMLGDKFPSAAVAMATYLRTVGCTMPWYKALVKNLAWLKS